MSEAERIMKLKKAEALKKPIPICPKCGSVAQERTTKFGIRAACCNLWSWDRCELVDSATHAARKHLGVLLNDLTAQLGATVLLTQLQRRVKGMSGVTMTKPRDLNEVSCKKVITACEDILIDVIAGDVKGSPPPKRVIPVTV